MKRLITLLIILTFALPVWAGELDGTPAANSEEQYNNAVSAAEQQYVRDLERIQTEYRQRVETAKKRHLSTLESFISIVTRRGDLDVAKLMESVKDRLLNQPIELPVLADVKEQERLEKNPYKDEYMIEGDYEFKWVDILTREDIDFEPKTIKIRYEEGRWVFNGDNKTLVGKHKGSPVVYFWPEVERGKWGMAIISDGHLLVYVWESEMAYKRNRPAIYAGGSPERINSMLGRDKK